MAQDPSASTRLPDVGDLAVLVAVAEQGGLSAAARTLGIAQPNASRVLARLERQLGLRLVTRSARGSSLTADGAVVVGWAREILEANHRLVEGSRALAGGHRGRLDIAASQTIAEELLPRWLAALRVEFPQLDVTLRVTNSADVGRLVSTRNVLGFVESPELPATITVPIVQRHLTSDRLVVVVAPDHEWARRTRPITRSELAATRLVVREPGSGTRVSLEQALVGLDLADPTLELASNVAVRVAVASGAGPAVLSELAVEAAVASGELRAVMVADLAIERPLRAVWAKRTKLPEEARRLLAIAAGIEEPRIGA